MQPAIIDLDTGKRLWTAQECTAHCGFTQVTWYKYQKRGTIPAPVGNLTGNLQLWDAEEVKDWNLQRPKRPARKI